LHLKYKNIIGSLVLNTEQLLEHCLAGDRKAQQTLYEKYSPVLLGICRRYISQLQDAEDVLMDGFLKIFLNLNQFDHRGSFEGWMKRIMINEALMWLRKRKLLQIELDEKVLPLEEVQDNRHWELTESDIIPVLDQLPEGYRTVFNLYVIEEYKHREIAELMGISINTSKSQLILAKKRMKQLLEQKKQSQND